MTNILLENRLGLYLSALEEVTVPAGHEVLMEVDDISLLITSNLPGISDEQLMPRSINTKKYYYFCINY
jgi:hypothetical protein